MADYTSLKNWLYELQVFGIKLGLSSTEALLSRLGNPERSFPAIHLAGTNGKGSTGAMITRILRQSGLKIGFYSSPHLVNLRERFLINGRMPSKERLALIMDKVCRVCDDSEPPTFFEYTTALAFEYFAQEGVDLAVIETGMGGRLDATNVLVPKVSLIQDIGLEHTEHLGETLKEIAWEKAGIIKPGVPVLSAASGRVPRRVIEDRAAELQAPLYRLGADFSARWTAKGLFYRGLDLKLSGLKPGLIGRHQGRNAAMALACLEILAKTGGPAVSEDDIRVGLEKVHWPGRLQVVPGRPRMLLDGAHNPAACRIMARALKDLDYKRLVVVLGSMADKDHRQVVKALAPLADELILTRAAYERSATPGMLARAADKLSLAYHLEEELASAIALAGNLAGEDDLVIITGSLFIVGEALQILDLTPVFEEA